MSSENRSINGIEVSLNHRTNLLEDSLGKRGERETLHLAISGFSQSQIVNFIQKYADGVKRDVLRELCDISKFTTAFQLLGPGWETISQTQLQALVYVARVRLLLEFVPGPQFEKEIMPLFVNYDATKVAACLNAIRRINFSELE